MGRPSEVAELIKQGLHPTDVSKELGVSQDTANEYLIRAATYGLISFVQIFVASDSGFQKYTRKKRHERDQQTWNSSINQFRRFAIAEHYLQIREIERTLHESVRTGLIRLFGEHEDGWWRKGVPKDIRGDCALRKENDEQGAGFDLFAYTNLMDLHKIIQKNWNDLSQEIGFLAGFNQQQFLDQLRQVNSIRNIVMHPVRIEIPTTEQLAFVEKFHTKLCDY